jgi:hypothetical protein
MCIHPCLPSANAAIEIHRLLTIAPAPQSTAGKWHLQFPKAWQTIAVENMTCSAQSLLSLNSIDASLRYLQLQYITSLILSIKTTQFS